MADKQKPNTPIKTEQSIEEDIYSESFEADSNKKSEKSRKSQKSKEEAKEPKTAIAKLAPVINETKPDGNPLEHVKIASKSDAGKEPIEPVVAPKLTDIESP
jgi:predicted carbohydrate-binding protein with CBM5 and CBM33 domain